MYPNVVTQPVLFSTLLELLTECGVDTRTPISQSPTGRVLSTLLLISEHSHREEITERIIEHDKLARLPVAAAPFTPTASNALYTDADSRARDMKQRRAAGVSQHFQTETKYTGAPGSPDLELVRLTYEQAVRKCMLVDEEPLSLVHHCFDADAKRFYFLDPKIKAAKDHQAVFDPVRDRFMSTSTRAAVTTKLRNLALAPLVYGAAARFTGDLQGALDELYREIERSMPKVLESSTGDRNAGGFFEAQFFLKRGPPTLASVSLLM
jgi:hypothetical protein